MYIYTYIYVHVYLHTVLEIIIMREWLTQLKAEPQSRGTSLNGRYRTTWMFTESSK